MSRLVYDPDPILRAPNVEIDDIDNFDSSLDLMKKIMDKHNGVGIAAPQVGLNVQLCMFYIGMKLYVTYNPKLTYLSKAILKDTEGCLSIPGKTACVDRHSEVILQYTNRDKEPRTERFSGYYARIVQHELDHLKGKLYIDKISPLRRVIL